ncbi:uncharacterized protein TNCV_4422811 [Trichonephila clavipes]|nr:uncharacterized protein TNCV_4422811 [Trichonephila clavipes]
MKSQTWLEIKEKERRFPEDDKALFNELRELQETVEKLKLQKNQEISKKVAAKEKVLSSLSVAHDFKSQHPFFLKANAREQIEFIETINERKLALLRKDQEKAQKNYQDATLKHRAEMWRVIEASDYVQNQDFAKRING